MQNFNQFNALHAPVSSFVGQYQSVPMTEPAHVAEECFAPDEKPTSQSIVMDADVSSSAAVAWASTTQPLYKSIACLVRTEIERGRFKAGDKLPSVRTMVVDFGVSHPTVLRAMEELASLGYVKLVQGSGTYVRKQPAVENSANAGAEQGDFLDQNQSKNRTTPSSIAESADAQSNLPIVQWRRCVRTALSEIGAQSALNTPAGLNVLRRAIADFVRRSRGIVVCPEQVFVMSGVSPALSFLSRLCLHSGDTVAVEDPGSPKIRRLLSAQGANVMPIALDSQGISPDALKKLDCQIGLLHVTPHQNPTGLAMTKQRRESLLNWAAHAGTLVLEDDFGSEFAHSTDAEASLFAQQQNDGVVYLGGFWGSLHPLVHSVYLLLPPTLAARAVTCPALRDCEMNLLEQHSLQHMIDAGHLELHLKRSKKIGMEKRALTISALKQTLGARVAIVGSSVNGRQLVRFRQDVETRNVVTAALRSGLPLVNVSDYFVEAEPANEFLLSFNALESRQIFSTVLHFAGLIK